MEDNGTTNKHGLSLGVVGDKDNVAPMLKRYRLAHLPNVYTFWGVALVGIVACLSVALFYGVTPLTESTTASVILCLCTAAALGGTIHALLALTHLRGMHRREGKLGSAIVADVIREWESQMPSAMIDLVTAAQEPLSGLFVFDHDRLFPQALSLVQKFQPNRITIVAPTYKGVTTDDPERAELVWHKAVRDWLKAEPQRQLRRILCLTADTTDDELQWTLDNAINPIVAGEAASNVRIDICDRSNDVSIVTMDNKVGLIVFPLERNTAAWSDPTKLLGMAIANKRVTTGLNKWIEEWYGSDAEIIGSYGTFDEAKVWARLKELRTRRSAKTPPGP